ncbi:hypothetical protein EV174_000311 [Coemansia sp. RSA 2320]|nr:hypothetical protein EV174_000311 [Coemansia sp. RSA 2320]
MRLTKLSDDNTLDSLRLAKLSVDEKPDSPRHPMVQTGASTSFSRTKISTDTSLPSPAASSPPHTATDSIGDAESAPTSAFEAGKSPFGLPSGDRNAAAFLAQCYTQMMKDSGSMRSGHPGAEASIDEARIQVFIFTNPRSGNQQGRGLMRMAMGSFRLRSRPTVQVQIYDVTDADSRAEGLHFLHQLQLRQGDRLLRSAFPELFAAQQAGRSVGASPAGSIGGGGAAWETWISAAAAQLEAGLAQLGETEVMARLAHAQESAVKLHVWSAGGDGTVSATIQAMMDHGIDVGRVYFSSIPFGTGNDFADALGWGRSVAGDALGDGMSSLSQLVTERLDGYTCKLDIYEVTFTTYDGGHVRHVEKGSGGAEEQRHTRLMIDYLSLGVQGFVGASFEKHRPGRRGLNILMYTVAAAHWVLARAFPPITDSLESVATVPDAMAADTALTDADRARWLETVPDAQRKHVLVARETHDASVPVIRGRPIELDVQNVARFWGRDIDVWGRAREAAGGDSRQWEPQYAGDGTVELFTVQSMADYTLNQLPARDTYRVARQAQLPAPVALHFCPPAEYPARRRRFFPWRRPPPPGLLFAMCDGEFVELLHPRDVIISRKVTLKAVGRSPATSRIVRDTIRHDGLDAADMQPTAAAAVAGTSTTRYVSTPFQRIFRRKPAAAGGPQDDVSVEAPLPTAAQHAASSANPLLALRKSLLRSVGFRRSLSDIRPVESKESHHRPLPLLASPGVPARRVHSKSVDLGRLHPGASTPGAPSIPPTPDALAPSTTDPPQRLLSALTHPI